MNGPEGWPLPAFSGAARRVRVGGGFEGDDGKMADADGALEAVARAPRGEPPLVSLFTAFPASRTYLLPSLLMLLLGTSNRHAGQ